MFVDWFTAIAQIVNFLILIWLFNRILYKPILQSIDEREKLISDQLVNADSKIKDAQIEKDEFQRKNNELQDRREELLKKAADDSNVERQKLLSEIRAESETLRLKLQETLKNEQKILQMEITRRIKDEVFAVARKALSELANQDLEERMCGVFICRLRELDFDKKKIIEESLKTSSNIILITSAFEVVPDQRSLIEKAFKENFTGEIQVKFETAPDLISGIEFTANGYKFTWSVSDYLTSLEKNVGGFLTDKLNLKQGTNEHAV